MVHSLELGKIKREIVALPLSPQSYHISLPYLQLHYTKVCF